jgi:hypothetical protein
MHWRALATSLQPLTDYPELLIDLLEIAPAIPPATAEAFPAFN